MKNHSSGSALIFILIAVALLGLLTIILTRSGSTTNQTGDVEKNKVKASEILRYAKSVESAVQAMKLRNVSENSISFAANATSVTYVNTNCDDASDRSYPNCLVFDVNGGGLQYRIFENANDGSDWIFTGANNVGTTAGPVGTTAATGGNDILMLLANMDESLCIQINRDLDVGTAGSLPIDTTGIATTAFTGTFASGGPTILDGDPSPFELNNENAGCFTDANAGVTYFYYTVLTR